MIPDHYIDQAAAAIYASTAFGDEFAIDAWHDMDDDNPVKTTTRMYARAALETTAEDIWDEAHEAGFKYGCDIGGDVVWEPEYTPNPYRASEGK